MNNNIRAIAKRSGAYFWGGSVDYFGEHHPPYTYISIRDLDLERFAELLIRECAAVALVEAKDKHGNVIGTYNDTVSNQILNHFEIKP